MKFSTVVSIFIFTFLLIIHFVSTTIKWDGTWAFGCDFNKNNLMKVQTRLHEDCRRKCDQILGCTHYTWTTANGGTCTLKQGPISEDKAVSTTDSSMICGVRMSTRGLFDGKTTRYWDCCKPSCSWPKKVFGSDTYVKSCRRDGYSVFNNPDGVSGCDGGDTFPCNNQKPWAINDHLAYGFAAATLPGLEELDHCCACFKLVFSIGLLQGKTMIVQIINSGSDVSVHQFNLQIPGGGVGQFNACSRQWNASNEGWGQRYGGVQSRQECYSLPAQIRDGCLFRFDWLKGADNPQMTYSKIACPPELVAITGCSRKF